MSSPPGNSESLTSLASSIVQLNMDVRISGRHARSNDPSVRDLQLRIAMLPEMSDSRLRTQAEHSFGKAMRGELDARLPVFVVPRSGLVPRLREQIAGAVRSLFRRGPVAPSRPVYAPPASRSSQQYSGAAIHATATAPTTRYPPARDSRPVPTASPATWVQRGVWLRELEAFTLSAHDQYVNDPSLPAAQRLLNTVHYLGDPGAQQRAGEVVSSIKAHAEARLLFPRDSNALVINRAAFDVWNFVNAGSPVQPVAKAYLGPGEEAIVAAFAGKFVGDRHSQAVTVPDIPALNAAPVAGIDAGPQ